MNIIGIVVALLVLNLIVIVHETGHFIIGRLLHFDILEYAIGMGPKLFGWRRKGIDYSIRLFPIGGYCKFAGEDGEDNTQTKSAKQENITVVETSMQNRPGVFFNRPWYQRLAVLFAGAGFNLVAALLASVLLCSLVGVQAIYITGVEPAAPAAIRQIQKGDRIIGVNGREVTLFSQVQTARLLSSPGESYTLEMQRGNERYTVHGQYMNINGQAMFGIGVDASRLDKTGFFTSVKNAVYGTGYLTADIFTVLGRLLTGKMSLSTLMGPVSTVGVMSGAVQEGAAAGAFGLLVTLLSLFSLISINLAVFNLLPIPALDGSRMIFVLLEGIRKKPINRNVEGAIHQIGFMALIALVVILEISHLFT